MNMGVQNPVHGKQNVGVGVKNTELWRMCLNSNDYLLLEQIGYGSAFANSMGKTQIKNPQDIQ